LVALFPLRAVPSDDKIHITYWEKWSGAEEIAMEEVIDEFNRSQNRIVVDFLSVGQIEEKTLLSTAGGNPPDLSGVYTTDVCAFADRDALTPLSPLIRADGSTPDQFLSRYARAYAGLGTYEGETWAVPTTPTTLAMLWNKDDFRAAGLDPERPPRTLAELDQMADKLTIRDARGNLKQVGFLPQVASGWIWALPMWFGGQIFDGKNITIGTDPAALKSFQWMHTYTTKYGVENIRRFVSTFGSISTPNDPFMTGKVAIIFDGVWRCNFIDQFAPGLSYGVAPMPQVVPGVDDFTVVDADMLVIPRGAKHPREAWEFIKYLSSPNLAAQSIDELSGLERLCYVQKKPSPLVQWSPFFTTHHPNPDIAVYRQLAGSTHSVGDPQMGIWDEYDRNINVAFDKMRLDLASPQQALQDCQDRMENSWQWHRESLALRGKTAGTP
jgi:ABC-type glycerol-3-phosphate transport system substrate-binding protein